MGLYLGLSVIPALLVAFLTGTHRRARDHRPRGRGGRKKAVPFGVFLALGGIVGVLVGPGSGGRLQDDFPRIAADDAGVSSNSGHFEPGVKCVQRAADTPLRTPMMFSLRKNSSGGSVGLDIDGRYLAAAQVQGGRVIRGASAELPAGLVSDGEVVNRDGLAEALKSFVAQAGLPKNVRLGVANQQIVVRVVELPRIEDEKQRDAAVRFQAAEAIAMPLDEAVLDHQVAGYTEAPDGTPRMQVVVVAARRSMIEALLDAVEGAGLKAGGHRPRRLRARAHARGRRRRRARGQPLACTATSPA